MMNTVYADRVRIGIRSMEGLNIFVDRLYRMLGRFFI